MFRKIICRPTIWLVMISIAIHATVGSCQGCNRNKKKTVVPASSTDTTFTTPTAPTAKLPDKLPTQLYGSTDSLHSEASTAASGSSPSRVSSGDSDDSSGYGSSGNSGRRVPTAPTPPAPPTPFAGLENINNSCYMNAVLQVIAAVYEEDVNHHALKGLIDKINTGSKSLGEEYMKLCRASILKSEQEHFKLGSQEDPYEFLDYLASVIEVLSPIECTEYCFFKKDAVYGITRPPDFKNLSVGAGCILPISILSNMSPLSTMIQHYQNHLVKADASFTGNWRTEDELPFLNGTLPDCVAQKQGELEPLKKGSANDYIVYRVFDVLPEKLCIYLVRSDYEINNKEANKKCVKNNYLVSKALHISITPNLHENKPIHFDLHAFIVHIGNKTGSGHYISYVKRGDKWYMANDSYIEEVTESTVENASQKAYLLFYKKR